MPVLDRQGACRRVVNRRSSFLERFVPWPGNPLCCRRVLPSTSLWASSSVSTAVVSRETS